MRKRTTRKKPVYMRTKKGNIQHMLDDNWEPYCQAPFQSDWRAEGQISGTQMHNPLCKMCVYVHARSEGASKAEAKRKAGITGDGESKRKTRRATAQVDRAESKRLGRHGKANSGKFWQRQSFGAASPVRHIDPAEYE